MVVIAVFCGVVVIAAIVLMILVFAAPGVFEKGKNKSGEVISAENNTKVSPSVKGEIIGDTKDFIPVVGFEPYAMDLGRHNYRAIVEVSSVNYMLMSDMEQEMIEQGYHNFLNSLHFPIQFYIQTREFDKDLMIDNLHHNILSSTKRFPGISDYAAAYEQNMSQLTQFIQNSKIKKKYIIVPFSSSDLSDVSELNNYEIKEFALGELDSRCAIVRGGLEAIGLKTRTLEKPEIAECLYSYYHRDAYRIASDIVLGHFDSLVIQKENTQEPDNRQKLDSVLVSCQNQIKNLHTAESSDQEVMFYQYIYDVLEYFKQNDRSSTVSDLLGSLRTNPKYLDYFRKYPEDFEASAFEHKSEVQPHVYNFDNPPDSYVLSNSFEDFDDGWDDDDDDSIYE